MKSIYPGDTEFTVENYWNLPYPYVVDAYTAGKKQQLRFLHSSEAPISLLTSLIANANRDTKKKKDPYKMEDFFLYRPKEEKNIPTAIYGSAAMALIAMRLYPTWALFIFKDLKEAADGDPPSILAYVGEDAMILAPVHDQGIVKGMLIATEKASGKRLVLQSPCNKTIYVEMPQINDKFFAKENIDLNVIN